jgi:hypothetical protein
LGGSEQLQQMLLLLSSEEGTLEEGPIMKELEQLNRLAGMDSNEYQQRLIQNQLPTMIMSSSASSTQRNSTTASTLSGGGTSSSSSSSATIQHCILQLSMSIHRLHSTVANITKENDGHSEEIRSVQTLLNGARNRNEQLEIAVDKLHRRNLRLKQTNKISKERIERLERKVTKQSSQIKCQKFQLMASKLQHHEMQLQLNAATATRNRIDSNFSDVVVENDADEDEGVDCGNVENGTVDDIVGVEDGTTSLAVESSQAVVADDEEYTTVPTDFIVATADDGESVTSHNTSLFDDVRPTLRFSANGSVDTSPNTSEVENNNIPTTGRERTWSANSVASSIFSCCKEEEDGVMIVGNEKDKLKQKEEASGDENNNTESGSSSESQSTTNDDTIKAIQKQSSTTTSVPTLPGMMSSFHSHFKFLNSRPVQDYTLKMVPPFTMQFVALKVRPSSSSDQADNNESTHATCGDLETVFAVSGFEGFDEATNLKPTSGKNPLRSCRTNTSLHQLVSKI